VPLEFVFLVGLRPGIIGVYILVIIISTRSGSIVGGDAAVMFGGDAMWFAPRGGLGGQFFWF